MTGFSVIILNRKPFGCRLDEALPGSTMAGGKGRIGVLFAKS